MSQAHETRIVLLEGRPYRRLPDGSLSPMEGESDWQKLDAISDDEVTARAMDDHDARPMTDEEWAQALAARPEKVQIGIRLDSDVIDWFKAGGAGYQTRINAVLRRFMESRRKAG